VVRTSVESKGEKRMIVDLMIYAEHRRDHQNRISRKSIIKKSIQEPFLVKAETFDAILAQLERYKEDHHGVTEKPKRILSSVPTQAQV